MLSHLRQSQQKSVPSNLFLQHWGALYLVYVVVVVALKSQVVKVMDPKMNQNEILTKLGSRVIVAFWLFQCLLCIRMTNIATWLILLNT